MLQTQRKERIEARARQAEGRRKLASKFNCSFWVNLLKLVIQIFQLLYSILDYHCK